MSILPWIFCLFRKKSIYLQCNSETPSEVMVFFKNENCVRTHVIDINQNTVKKGKKAIKNDCEIKK